MTNVATKTEPKAEPKAEEIVLSEANKKLMADTTVSVDRGLMEKVTVLENLERQHQKAQGGKWAMIAQYAIDNKLTDKVILKTLLSMGKTESSAYSIRTTVTKLIKNPELLAKVKEGAMTVREARAWGRKAQANPSKTDQDRFDGHIRDAGRYAGALGMTKADFMASAEKAFNDYASSEAKALAGKGQS